MCCVFFKALQDEVGPCSPFLQWELFGGDCGRMLQQVAARRGFRPVTGFEAIFPGSDFVAQLSPGSWINRQLNLRVTRDLPAKVAQFCADLSPDLPERIEPRRWYVPLNDLVKPHALKAYDRYKRALTALPERCTKGGWCIDACPEQAITLTEDSVAVDPERCSLCFRCYHHCPEQALVFFGRDDRGRYAGPQEARNFVPLAGPESLPPQCERSA